MIVRTYVKEKKKSYETPSENLQCNDCEALK